MTRQFWKKQVRVILTNGTILQRPRQVGERLIKDGSAILVKGERRFTVRLLGPLRVPLF